MNKYRIRFNKTRGQPGRGTADHVWRVFENEKEYLFKHLNISVPTKSERDDNGQDYNIVCVGYLRIDRETSTAFICEAERLISQEQMMEPQKPGSCRRAAASNSANLADAIVSGEAASR